MKKILTITALALAACDTAPPPEPNPNEGEPAVRELVFAGLQGSRPLDVRVTDPDFALVGSADSTWTAYSGASQRDEADALARARLEGAPGEGWALGVWPSQLGGGTLQLFGELWLAEGPSSVSVWLGRPFGASDEGVFVSLQGMKLADGEYASVPLEEDPGRRVAAAGIAWRHFSIETSAFVGMAFFHVEDPSKERLFVHDPRATSAEGGASSLVRLAPPVALSAEAGARLANHYAARALAAQARAVRMSRRERKADVAEPRPPARAR